MSLYRRTRAIRRTPAQIAAEKAAKLALSMTCQCCARQIFAQRGVIAHHGYERPFQEGWQTASCYGATYVPFEVSRERLGVYIDAIVDQISHKRVYHIQVQTDQVSVTAAHQINPCAARVVTHHRATKAQLAAWRAAAKRHPHRKVAKKPAQTCDADAGIGGAPLDLRGLLSPPTVAVTPFADGLEGFAPAVPLDGPVDAEAAPVGTFLTLPGGDDDDLIGVIPGGSSGGSPGGGGGCVTHCGPAAVPEPDSWVLMIVGMAILGAALRMRRFAHG